MTGKANWLGSLVAGLLGGVLLVGPMRHAAANDFYAGRTINLVVGTDVGGGFSIYGRLITRHLGRFIPGNPTLVMRNMPGAGGSTAATHLYRTAAKDGTVIGAVPPNAILGRLMDESQSQYHRQNSSILPVPSVARGCA
jgi:tripartite-type tricarboxylate transporter receptor subunit TctC